MKYELNYSQKTQPLQHQTEATNFVRDNNVVALFDEMGLGKTKIVLDALLQNLHTGDINCAMVICKKTLVHNWENEIDKHTHLHSIILRGSDREKGMRFMANMPFYIINYDALIKEVKRLHMLLKIKKAAIVLDESHRIKDPHSKAAQSLFLLAPLAKKRIIISGTPVANKPFDIWSQFYFLDSGNLLGTNYESFKKEYSIDFKNNKLNKIKMQELRDMIKSVSIRRLKQDVLELPDKKFESILVDLKGKQKDMYNQLKNDLYLEISNMDGNQIIDKSENILKRLLRLNQIASNPKLIDESYDEEPVKFSILDKLIKDILGKNEKLIIWSSFIENILTLKSKYKKYGAVTIFGKMNIEDRNSAVIKFLNDTDCKILIANPPATPEGLTLTAANNAIYVDRSFNLVDYIQSQDRIHRISQIKDCNIMNILANDTIDMYIDEIIFKKQNIARFLQGDSDKIMPKREFLTKKELIKILGG